MGVVHTVTGDVDAADLGVTLMHEHVFVLTPDIQQNYPEDFGDEDARVDDAVAQLQKAYDAGVRTIVDPTVVGLGRYIPRIQRVAERTPVRIVAATGVYTYRDVPRYFMYRGPALTAMTGIDFPDPMVDMFVRDIEQGIADTGVKAGMLKCAIDHHGLTEGVERVMRAVAKAHNATGVPITVHTHPGSETGLLVKQVMCDEEGGPEPDRAGAQWGFHRCRSPLGAGRRRLHAGLRPFRHQPGDHLRGAQRDAHRDGAPRLHGEDRAVAGRLVLHRLDRPERQGGHAPVALHARLRGRVPVRPRARRHSGSDRHHAGLRAPARPGGE
ncbi:hypothetical protein MTP03_20590 [Tsukamurella sp. PLM1]|nr:hypothetical protein MTP03_20590 [Tsukamurella sp. PLM1]